LQVFFSCFVFAVAFSRKKEHKQNYLFVFFFIGKNSMTIFHLTGGGFDNEAD